MGLITALSASPVTSAGPADTHHPLAWRSGPGPVAITAAGS
jgi:hypothetical protein